jgi:hypothetical protein
MEVHHHAHTARKKWTHYFWEFLMLFLAVFCGFLAEYQLEHKIEKDREKQFMKSLLEDLKKDSTDLAFNKEKGPLIVKYSDSLINQLKQLPLQGKEKKLYHFYSLISDGITIRYHDRTVSQLRNSGGFRLLSREHVSNAILDYDVLMREAHSYGSSIESWSFVQPALTKSAAIFDISLVFAIYDDARRYIHHTDSIHFPEEVKLITYNEATIKEYRSLQRFAQLTDQVKLYYSKQALDKNQELDSLIRKEYKIK